MTGLTDTQSILLSTASQRQNGSIYPLPSTLRTGGGTAKSVAALSSIGLAEERETTTTECVSRTDGDLRYGMFITAAGLQAIGVDDDQPLGNQPAEPASTSAAAKPPRNTKITAVLALLQRPEGSTVAELIAATSWLPHTTRAALTGLKKKGHSIERFKREGTTCYRVVTA